MLLWARERVESVCGCMYGKRRKRAGAGEGEGDDASLGGDNGDVVCK